MLDRMELSESHNLLLGLASAYDGEDDAGREATARVLQYLAGDGDLGTAGVRVHDFVVSAGAMVNALIKTAEVASGGILTYDGVLAEVVSAIDTADD